LQQCFSSLSSLQANQASLERLQPLLHGHLSAGLQSTSSSPPLPAATDKAPLLQLQQLSFRYSHEGPWVLRDLELAIQPGERIAFVGSTGSGKSTTSDLILGLLEPTQGRLLVHDQDLQATPGLVGAWQQRVAHVPQSIYLSDASFAANIAFGLPEAEIDQRRVMQAAEQAQISELIESSSEGYSTVVGERGVRLSGGQRQRIGLARALYKQAELLVLDEATSALDNRTEAEVMAAIEGLDGQITVILIAHRLSTIQSCDRIVLLDRGSIAGLGSYTELLACNGPFQRLVRERNPLNS
jgi:ATP-binding cassette, subfamily B, bacterial PglK